VSEVDALVSLQEVASLLNEIDPATADNHHGSESAKGTESSSD